jgi:hypothetical protein
MSFPIGTRVRIRQNAYTYDELINRARGVMVGRNEIAFVPDIGRGHHGSSGDENVNNRWYISEQYLELDGPPLKLEDFV